MNKPDIHNRKTLSIVDGFNDFFDLIPILICIASSDGYFKRLNAAWNKTLGFSSKELMQKPFIEFVHPDDRASTLNVLKKLTQGQRVASFVNRYRCKDGTYRYLEWNPAGRTGKDSFFAVAKDITEHREVVARLHDSEEKYRRLFEAESDAILLLDCEIGRFIDANPAAERLYGYPRSTFIKLKPVDISAEPEKTMQAISERQTRIPMRWHRKKNGEVFPVEIFGSYFESHGRKIHVAAIRDITERKKAQDLIKASEEQYREFTENLNEVVFRLEPKNFSILYVNPAVEKLVGIPRQKLYEKPNLWTQFIYSKDRKRVLGQIRKALLEKKDLVLEFRVTCVAKKVRWVEGFGHWEKDNKGKVSSLSGVIVDITARKEMEQELRRSQKKLLAQKNALERKNLAFQEILRQIETSRSQIKDEILKKVEKATIPLMRKITLTQGTPLRDLLHRHLKILPEKEDVPMPKKYFLLSPREREVASLIRDGISTKEIANILGLSSQTVNIHRKSIRKKFGLQGTTSNLTTFLQVLSR